MLRKATSIGVLGALSTLMCVSLAGAQSQQAPAAPARGNQAGAAPAGRGGFMPGNFDPNQIRQMMDDYSRQSLNATPDEWRVLGPRFNKVQTLTRSINGGAMGMFGMGRGGMGVPGGPGGMGSAMTRGFAAVFGEPTELDKARDNLLAALDSNSPPTGLQAAIKAFRGAKLKIRQDLVTAQADLRKICTVPQEATLLAMGLLD
jgi:hypothetical protein